MFSHIKTVYKKNRWFDRGVKEALDVKLEQSSATHNTVFPIHTAIEIHTRREAIPRGYIREPPLSFKLMKPFGCKSNQMVLNNF